MAGLDGPLFTAVRTAALVVASIPGQTLFPTIGLPQVTVVISASLVIALIDRLRSNVSLLSKLPSGVRRAFLGFEGTVYRLRARH